MSGSLDLAAARGWVDAFLDAADRERTELGELDRRSGDGDFGTNLLTSIRRARTDLEAATPGVPGDVFGTLSRAFLQTGGTSGPLYGMWFREFQQACGQRAEIGLLEVAAAVANGLATVQRLGKAEPGDKTMVDAMAPASEALAVAVRDGVGLAEGLASAARAARIGAEATGELLARRGRASYVGEVARGVIDPGAVAVALFFESAVTSA